MKNKNIDKFNTKKLSVKEDPNITMGTLYDMNKQLMTQTAKPLSPMELVPIQYKLSEWFNWEIDCYAMLLCHERRDYTVFRLYGDPPMNSDPPAVATNELLSLLTDRGEILAIDETEDKAWEIWLKINEEPYCYYLFNYDNAVIEC